MLVCEEGVVVERTRMFLLSLQLNFFPKESSHLQPEQGKQSPFGGGLLFLSATLPRNLNLSPKSLLCLNMTLH